MKIGFPENNEPKRLDTHNDRLRDEGLLNGRAVHLPVKRGEHNRRERDSQILPPFQTDAPNETLWRGTHSGRINGVRKTYRNEDRPSYGESYPIPVSLEFGIVRRVNSLAITIIFIAIWLALSDPPITSLPITCFLLATGVSLLMANRNR